MALLFAKNNSLSAVTALPASISGGDLNLISTQTASSSASIDFTSGIDSTYKEYIFKFINVQASGTNVAFQVNFRDGGSNFDATKTTTFFYAEHAQDASSTAFSYLTSRDEEQSSNGQHLTTNVGRTGDNSASGTLNLFDPSNTTFVKNFIARSNNKDSTSPNYSQDVYVAGYCNVTAAIDGVQFSMSSGNITAGTIKMYGVS